MDSMILTGLSPLLAYIAAGCAALILLIAVFIGYRAILCAGTGKSVGCQTEEVENEELPSATVVLFSKVDDERLADTLRQIYAQDYPRFSVVVVCDTTFEHKEDIAERFRTEFPGIHVTFIPSESHNLSRRKLANTIGVKAADGEVLVTTVANIEIPSERWLFGMLAPFADGEVEVALGCSRLDYSEMRSLWRWYREFDDTLAAARWAGEALSGNPYRGDGYNLAFRRDTFFKNKGYAKTINLHYGDDDLFVNEISDGRNTRVVLSPDTILRTEWGDSSSRVWSLDKDRYDFTSRGLPRGPFIKSGMVSAAQWLVTLLSAVAVAVGIICGDMAAAVVGVVPWLALVAVDIATYRRIAARFGALRLWWAVWPFMMARPVVNFFFRMRHRRNSVKNYTWQRHK